MKIIIYLLIVLIILSTNFIIYGLSLIEKRIENLQQTLIDRSWNIRMDIERNSFQTDSLAIENTKLLLKH